jgi:hypothetical protein
VATGTISRIASVNRASVCVAAVLGSVLATQRGRASVKRSAGIIVIALAVVGSEDTDIIRLIARINGTADIIGAHFGYSRTGTGGADVRNSAEKSVVTGSNVVGVYTTSSRIAAIISADIAVVAT